MTETRYLLCATHDWNRRLFEQRVATLPGSWHFVSSREELTPALIAQMNPRYAFFLHWSWLVPAEILSAVEAVCFHMTDLPYGRGGSPLQNLIQRGHKTTMLSALRMTASVDAGPIYLKQQLDLSGRAQDIYERASRLAFNMIETIILTEPAPREQQGEPTLFRRRTPSESTLPTDGDLETLFDHIRMLDAADYPHAFIEHGKYRIEFTNADLLADGLVAQVRVTTGRSK
ncbi:MAG: methionyl-tRNA formyltransferase [Alphaproteobacteria bacterium]|nr:methionyl-tRNA formyltransferase [Alphaproteobacteria bacterium]